MKWLCRNKSYLRLSTTLTRNYSDKIIKSKVANVAIPQLTLNDFIWKNLDKWHDKTALICADTGRNYLYSDVYAKCNKISDFLTNFKGLRKGDVVATILPNVPEYPIVALGAILGGFKITSVNATFTKDEMERQLVDADVKIIFTLTELASIVYNAVETKNIPVVLINHTQEQMPIPSNAIKFKEIFEREYKPSFNSTSSEDVIYIPYSSGTTGLPKGVELTTTNMVVALSNLIVPEFDIQPPLNAGCQQVLPNVLPMFHIYGMMSTLVNLSTGSKIVSMTKFSTDGFVKLLKAHKPTYSYLIPTIINLLLNNPLVKTEDIVHMRTIGSSASTLSQEDNEKFAQKTHGKTDIILCFGLTECAGATHCQSRQIPGGTKRKGIGLIYPNHECKIINISGENEIGLGPNQQGELLIRGPQVFKGYLNNAQATQSAIDSEGWYHTGDVGYYDEDEHFFITDRLKDIIKVKGFQVAPAELEEVLRSHPDVEEAAVIGIPHSVLGEVPKAFVVVKSKTNCNCGSIQEYVASKVAKHKQLIGGIAVIDSIPKGPSGKILRKKLKNL